MADQDDIFANSSDADVVAAPQGFGERLGGSFVAILFGIVLVPLACFGLFWNEGHAVHVAKALAELGTVVRSIPTDRRDPALDGKPVHIAGTVTSAAGVADTQVGLHVPGIHLDRQVEMYQWRESESGSGQDRKYTYRREWSAHPIASDRFHAPSGHQNPSFPAIRSRHLGAADARIDAVPVGAQAAQMLVADEPVAADAAGAAALARATGRPAIVDGGAYFVGRDAAEPKVGDLKILYHRAPERPASFIGRQEGTGLTPFRTTNGEEILLAEPGTLSAEALIARGHEDNRVMTWILRIAGMVVLLIGFGLFFAPVNLLASLVPLLGSLVAGATFLIALAATLLVGPTVIALAWLAYRPLLALGIIAAALLVAGGLFALRRRRTMPLLAPA